MHFSSIGMLLEQHKDAILKLLSDPSLLEEQVHLAMKTLKEYVVFFVEYFYIWACSEM